MKRVLLAGLLSSAAAFGAVAQAADPILMATAFRGAIEAGRNSYRAGAMPERQTAQPSTPVMGTPFWHSEK